VGHGAERYVPRRAGCARTDRDLHHHCRDRFSTAHWRLQHDGSFDRRWDAAASNRASHIDHPELRFGLRHWSVRQGRPIRSVLHSV